MADSYEFACERLRQAGYDHYEISNWALPGFRSRHNLKYWRREPYLGFGAGAHAFDGRFRWANAHDPAAYAAAIENGRLPLEELEEVTPKQALDEELFWDYASSRASTSPTSKLNMVRGSKRSTIGWENASKSCALKAWWNATAPACASRPPAWPSRTKSSSPCWTDGNGSKSNGKFHQSAERGMSILWRTHAYE